MSKTFSPIKAQCTESSRGRHVHRSFFADYVERVKGYQQTFAYQKALRKRQVWVEPLAGVAQTVAWDATVSLTAALACQL